MVNGDDSSLTKIPEEGFADVNLTIVATYGDDIVVADIEVDMVADMAVDMVAELDVD